MNCAPGIRQLREPVKIAVPMGADHADLNADTTVDIADYAILSANFGEVGD